MFQFCSWTLLNFTLHTLCMFVKSAQSIVPALLCTGSHILEQSRCKMTVEWLLAMCGHHHHHCIVSVVCLVHFSSLSLYLIHTDTLIDTCDLTLGELSNCWTYHAIHGCVKKKLGWSTDLLTGVAQDANAPKNCEKMFHIYFCSHPHRTQYARRLRVMTRVKKFERLDFGIRGYLEQRHHWSQLLLKRHRHYQPQQQSTWLLLSRIFCIIYHVVGQSSQCNEVLFLTKFTNSFWHEQPKNPVFPAEIRNNSISHRESKNDHRQGRKSKPLTFGSWAKNKEPRFKWHLDVLK